MSAAAATGEPADIIAATYLIESNHGNLAPYNYGNSNGTVDIGPMQLNYSPGSNRWPAVALGTKLGAGQQFNGNAYQNILAGAKFLKSLPDPGDYRSKTPSLRQARDNALDALTPHLGAFFDCLETPQVRSLPRCGSREIE